MTHRSINGDRLVGQCRAIFKLFLDSHKVESKHAIDSERSTQVNDTKLLQVNKYVNTLEFT